MNILLFLGTFYNFNVICAHLIIYLLGTLANGIHLHIKQYSEFRELLIAGNTYLVFKIQEHKDYYVMLLLAVCCIRVL